MVVHIIDEPQISDKRKALTTISQVISWRAKGEHTVFRTHGKASVALQSICSDGISWVDMYKISNDKNFLVQWTRYLGQYSKIIINGRVMKDEENVESSVSII